MDDNVHVLHEIIESTGSGEVPSDGHGGQITISLPTGFHFICFGLGSRCPGDCYSTFKEEVDDVGAHVTSGTGDENVAGPRFVRARRTPGAIDSLGNKRHSAAVQYGRVLGKTIPGPSTHALL